MTPGTNVRSYEILAPIGAGGMGEVYRARDTEPWRSNKITSLRRDRAGKQRRPQVVSSTRRHFGTRDNSESTAHRRGQGDVQPEKDCPVLSLVGRLITGNAVPDGG
jgi:hypothetical protein